MRSKPEHKQPVQLQVNNSGAWKTVCHFDACQHKSGVMVMDASRKLQKVDASLRFRISKAVDGQTVVLFHLDAGEWKSCTPTWISPENAPESLLNRPKEKIQGNGAAHAEKGSVQ